MKRLFTFVPLLAALAVAHSGLAIAVKEAGFSPQDVATEGASPRSDPPAQIRTHGSACMGGLGEYPRIEYAGDATSGSALDVTVRDALFGSPAALMVGLPTNFSLDVIGLTGCTVYVSPIAMMWTTTDLNGDAGFHFWIPGDGSAVGLELEFQWLIMDAGVLNVVPIVLSDALSVQVGVP